ncbi:MAG: thiamine-phosphate pyrophosphorylase [Candidatus Omnitrophica bacterium]|nr:thiamine-phosphate pyrophosphorylase [Candidatus Omnitrophota bacterium]
MVNTELAKALRIIDANLNRSREGLRVCEEVMRFYLEDQALAKEYKVLRHHITGFIQTLDRPFSELLEARDVLNDVGKELDFSRTKDDSVISSLFLANIERAKEALRVLEEFSKSYHLGDPSYFKTARYKLYALEKETIAKINAVRNS